MRRVTYAGKARRRPSVRNPVAAPAPARTEQVNGALFRRLLQDDDTIVIEESEFLRIAERGGGRPAKAADIENVRPWFSTEVLTMSHADLVKLYANLRDLERIVHDRLVRPS